MAYELDWSIDHPGHLVYLLDLSGSMGIKDQNGRTRIDELQEVLFDSAEELIQMNTARGKLKNKFSITIIGYNSEVKVLHDGDLISLKQLRDNAIDKNDEDKHGPMLHVETKWQTYTADAFKAAAANIRQWIEAQTAKGKRCPAPIVIHITDGIPEEKNLLMEEAREKALIAANELKAISVPDGNVLLFNIHIEPSPNKKPKRFLSTPPQEANERFLYEASSVMDEKFATKAVYKLEELESLGVNLDEIKPGSHFMVSNETNRAILTSLIVFGSSVSSRFDGFETPKPD